MSKTNLTHQISRATLILVLALFSTTTAWATITGSGTAADPYLINSSEDWNTFAQNVTNGTSYADQFVKLAADITVTTMAGTRNSDTNYHAFSGTLDGDGHTITANLSGDGYGTALFYVIDGATLTNMRVRGTVATNGRRPATFAAFVEGSSTINHCWSTVAVSSTQTGWVDGGAFVARVSGNATLNMSDCAFHGSVTYDTTSYSGGSMVGFTQTDATVNLTNCLYSPTALVLTLSAYSPHVFVSGDERGNLTNCYYNAVAAASILENEGNDASNMTNEALAAALGAGWHVSYGMVLPSGLEAYVVMLTSESGEVTLQDGDVLTGTGGQNTKVKIADGATVTLCGVHITAILDDYYNPGTMWPGITCLGDAVIVLAEGTTNNVKGGSRSSGIYVPEGHTLTLQGSGILNATGGSEGAGIGSGGWESSCGDITISGGTVTATGGYEGAGIGSGCVESTCGDITISGGTVNATGGNHAAGIGSGYLNSFCGNITVSGGTVMATGGVDAAGIGSGRGYYNNISFCGNITITNGVTMVTATKGSGADNAIGAGKNSTCGTVTINGVQGFITQSPYTILTKTIAGYGMGDGGWNLIALPVYGTLNPATVGNMIANTATHYDLFRFEPSHQGTEWHNYKSDSSFRLVNGKGYLYANKNNVTLTFSGPAYYGDVCQITLVYDSTDYRKCWNLVGNPFPCAATLDRPYYILSDDGTDINPNPVPATTPVPPCTAVFVKAVSVGDTAVFTKATQ